MSQQPIDTEKIHRWFAVEYNNTAWDLLENPRTPEQDAELIHVAHASAYHWSMGGEPINLARAECVVANAHAALGDGPAALRHAQRCIDLNTSAGEKCSDWDRAFAADALSRATAANGNLDQAEKLRKEARALGDAISEDGNRDVFDKWFNNPLQCGDNP